MKISLTILFIPLILSGFSQQNEVGIIPFKIEKTSETFQKSFESKFTGGVYYNRFFEKLHWSTEFIIGKNKINDDCENCLATAKGTGDYGELSLASGLGLRVHGEKSGGLTGDVRLLMYSALTGYSGTFTAAESAWYFSHDNRFLLLGAQLQYSLSYTFDFGLQLGGDVALKYSRAWLRQSSLPSFWSIIPTSVFMATLPSVRLGYKF